jgi:hypothetical protein
MTEILFPLSSGERDGVRGVGYLDIGNWSLFGIWNLVIGI